MVSAICPGCHILLVEASSSSVANLGASVDTAARLGATEISNAYSGSEFSQETGTAYNGHYNHPGIPGTESAWSGAGSGCSRYIAKPAWQHDTGCARRTVADVSAVADPSTGVAVYDSTAFQGASSWMAFGGTSVAAPVVASVDALAANSAPLDRLRRPDRPRHAERHRRVLAREQLAFARG